MCVIVSIVGSAAFLKTPSEPNILFNPGNWMHNIYIFFQTDLDTYIFTNVALVLMFVNSPWFGC